MSDRSAVGGGVGLRVALVATAADRGGAHVAATRLHHGLLDASVDSTYVAGFRPPGILDVGRPSSLWQRTAFKIRSRIGQWCVNRWGPVGQGKQSINFLPSGLARRMNRSGVDVVHLHWVNNELLSIEEIGKISLPMVWTLHDMWAFCGSEHYVDDPSPYLGPAGSEPEEWPSRLAQWTWHRKRRAWAGVRPLLVAPSRWLGDLASRSRLLGQLPVEVVPYGLNLDCFRPPVARPREAGSPLRIVFGAAGGASDPRKGFDLFVDAMEFLAKHLEMPAYEVIFFGASEPSSLPPMSRSIPVRSAGFIESDEAMAKLFGEADVFVATSRLDNLPNTVLEATACGVPTVAFRIGGMPDMIDHGETGFLARPFDAADLADGIAWILADDARREAMKLMAREKAEKEFGSARQAARILEVYDRAITQAH